MRCSSESNVGTVPSTQVHPSIMTMFDLILSDPPSASSTIVVTLGMTTIRIPSPRLVRHYFLISLDLPSGGAWPFTNLSPTSPEAVLARLDLGPVSLKRTEESHPSIHHPFSSIPCTGYTLLSDKALARLALTRKQLKHNSKAEQHMHFYAAKIETEFDPRTGLKESRV